MAGVHGEVQLEVHSLTVADVDGRTAKFRQVSAAGDVIDTFSITK